jgi:hypothetical protein
MIEPEQYFSSEDGLVLLRVRFESPGFWEILGSLNPLEQIRKYINERHERKKDRDYRNAMEKQRLAFQNAKMHADIVAQQVEVLRKAGFSKPEIRQLFLRHEHNPLKALGDAAEKIGVIDVKVGPVIDVDAPPAPPAQGLGQAMRASGNSRPADRRNSPASQDRAGFARELISALHSSHELTCPTIRNLVWQPPVTQLSNCSPTGREEKRQLAAE